MTIRNKYILYICVSLLLLLPTSIFAENNNTVNKEQNERPVISYSDALNLLKKNSSEIKIAKLERDNTNRKSNSIKSFIPSLALSSNITTGTQILSPSTAKQDKMTFSKDPSLTAVASLSFGANNIADIFSQKLQNEVASYTYSATLDNLELSLFELYASLSSTIDALEVATESYQTAQVIANNTKSKYDAGLTSSLELLNARLSISKAEETCANLTKTRNSLYYSLKNLLKLDYDFDIQDESETPFITLPSSAELYKKYLFTNSTIKALNLDYKGKKIIANATAVGARTPNASVNLTYNHPTSNSDILTLGINASMSLDGFIPGTSMWNSIKEAEKNLEVSSIKLKDGYAEFRINLEKNIEEISSLEISLKSKIAQLSLSKESYRLTKEAYDTGNVPMTTLADSLDAELGCEVALISALLDYKKAVYKFSTYLGDNFDNFIKIYSTN